jgi:hypothetical protein
MPSIEFCRVVLRALWCDHVDYLPPALATVGPVEALRASDPGSFTEFERLVDPRGRVLREHVRAAHPLGLRALREYLDDVPSARAPFVHKLFDQAPLRLFWNGETRDALTLLWEEHRPTRELARAHCRGRLQRTPGHLLESAIFRQLLVDELDWRAHKWEWHEQAQAPSLNAVIEYGYERHLALVLEVLQVAAKAPLAHVFNRVRSREGVVAMASRLRDLALAWDGATGLSSSACLAATPDRKVAGMDVRVLVAVAMPGAEVAGVALGPEYDVALSWVLAAPLSPSQGLRLEEIVRRCSSGRGRQPREAAERARIALARARAGRPEPATATPPDIDDDQSGQD